MSESRRCDPRANNTWEAVYSANTLRAALRRLFPRSRRMHQNHDYVINATAHENRVNELEETASTRSSFEDLWDSTSIEIRDGSYQRGEFNPTTSLLQSCKSQVIFPYFCVLCMVAWRPFRRHSFQHQRFWKIMNILYTLLIFLLILFSYASTIIACQARLDMKAPQMPTTPKFVPSTLLPTTMGNTTAKPTRNATTGTRIHRRISGSIMRITTETRSVSNGTSSIVATISTAPTLPSNDTYHKNTTAFTAVPAFTLATAKHFWQPAVMECYHIFSTYVVPNIMHFLAFALGFYHFRIQESEGLHALIEKVFLLSSVPNKIVTRLRLFLFLGTFWVLLSTGNFVLFCYAFSLPSVTGFKTSKSAEYTVASLMGLGKVLECCITGVIVVNYCAQCELLIFYLREISLRMEEKTGDLNIIMKDVLEVKKNLSRVNGIISIIATLVVFNNCEILVIDLYYLVLLTPADNDSSTSVMFYRGLVSFTSLLIVICPIAVAARLTSVARIFKQKSLQIRVFGYPSSSQLDLDSFVLFSHSSALKAKLLCMPVKGSFVMGFTAMIVFVTLLMLQTGVIAGSNPYI